MVKDSSLQLLITTLAKGAMAELRTLVNRCTDRETARVIYNELRQIVTTLEERFEFGKEKRKP